jgi:signal transduction histidine kinase
MHGECARLASECVGRHLGSKSRLPYGVRPGVRDIVVSAAVGTINVAPMFNSSGGIIPIHEQKMAADIESKTVSRIPISDRTVAFACASAIVIAVVEVILDLATWVELDIATIYGIPLVLAAFTRNRRLLWGLAVALTLATFIAYTLQIPVGTFALREGLFVNRVLDAVALLVTASLVQMWMLSLDIREAQAQLLEEQNRKLEVANDLLVAHEAQIVSQNEELTRRRHEAEEASGRKTRLLNAVSHDIRNPVNTINLMAEVIRRTAEDPALAMQVPQMARRLQSNAQSLIALVSEVLDIAHLDSGLLQLHESTFSLNEFVDAKCRDLAPLAEAKSLQLTSEAPERTVRVRGDRVKLDRIVTNLVTNAIKFTTSGSVTLSTVVAADGAVAIRVRDTGVGIADDELGRIFDEFAQFNVPLGKLNGGWGLGLAISRRLANFIGASITVESELGRGTVFTVLLPNECVVDVAPVVLPGSW